MSKLVKDLITTDIRQRLSGQENVLLVSLAGLTSKKDCKLRATLREKQISVLVIKNSLARRAVEGTPLAPAFERLEGSLAVCWGSTDIVALSKEVMRLADDKEFAPFKPCGGVMDGQRLSADQVKDVSKWPSREEVLSKLVGQILGPGAQLAAQLLGPGGALASQVEQIHKKDEEAPAEAPAA